VVRAAIGSVVTRAGDASDQEATLVPDEPEEK
jgi:hypothetical protein